MGMRVAATEGAVLNSEGAEQPGTWLTLLSRYIPDSLVWFGPGRPPRPEPGDLCGVAVDEDEGDVGEADEPVAVVAFAHPDGFADQRFRDEHQTAAPPDLAGRTHAANLLVGTIARVLETLTEGARRGAVEVDRRLLAERLMRPLDVVLLAEPVEVALLLARGRSRRIASLGLERSVHPLMAAVLLRLARINPLQPDPHLRPARRKPRQPAGAGRGEGRAVVGAYPRRQTVFAEQPIDHRLDRRANRGDDLHAEQIAAEGVAYRQRIAPASIAGPEPALEVNAPGVVGRGNRDERLIHRQRPPPTPPRLAQTLAPQNIGNGARRRPRHCRIFLAQHRQQLLRTPIRLALARLDQPNHQLRRRRPTMPVRGPRAFRQTLEPVQCIAPLPQIARLPADPVALAQNRHRLLVTQEIRNELHLLIHH